MVVLAVFPHGVSEREVWDCWPREVGPVRCPWLQSPPLLTRGYVLEPLTDVILFCALLGN